MNYEATRSRGTLGSGVSAGILGGILMGMLGMIIAAVSGPGFFAPLKMISATLLGRDAMMGGAGTILLGLGIHLVTSAAWGAIFALIVPRRLGTGAAAGLGALFGLGVYLVMTWLVLPWANPMMFENVNRGWFLVEHLIFGVTLGLVVPMRRRIDARAPGQRTAVV